MSKARKNQKSDNSSLSSDDDEIIESLETKTKIKTKTKKNSDVSTERYDKSSSLESSDEEIKSDEETKSVEENQSDEDIKISDKGAKKKTKINKQDINNKEKVNKKEVNLYNKIEYDANVFDEISDEFITKRVAIKFRTFLEKDTYKETELKKMYNIIWNHSIGLIYFGFIHNTKDLSSILDKIDNMITLNKRLFDNNIKLKSSDKSGNSKSYTKNKDLNIYTLQSFKEEKRVQKEIIHAWNLLFIALSILEMIDINVYNGIVKTFKVSEIFTYTYNNFLEWYYDTEGGCNFTSILRILKKQRVQKQDIGQKLIREKKRSNK